MYDPKKDRFIFISQYGYTNFSNAFQVLGVAVAFSKSNNPSAGWNYYFLPDTGFNDNAIGDYPLLESVMMKYLSRISGRIMVEISRIPP
jgi:hypothetical protein